MYTEVLSLPGGNAEISERGRICLTSRDGARLHIEALPFDRGYDQPYPYNTLIQLPLDLPLLAPENSNSPAGITWRLERQGDVLDLHKETGDWRLRQQIQVENGALVIESFITKPTFSALPHSLNVIVLPKQPFFDAAKLLLMPGSMGLTSVFKANAVEEEFMSKTLFAVQRESSALLINSEIGSARPLQMAFWEGIWHGLVPLPHDPDNAGELSLGRIEIRLGESAQVMLEEMARRTKPAGKVRPALRCWNSWDYYHSSISHDKIMENARAIAADPVLRECVDCIAPDMGWEVRFGQWTADPDFPQGMARLAEDIKSLGFRAGLWLAPIIIDPECGFFQDNYDWVGKNKYGFPDHTYECCGLFGYPLDVTRKEGADYLRDLFKGFRDMGYTYFKLDFLRYIMYAHRYTDGTVNNVQVMQRALELIREGAGDDAYILACNLPFEIGPGYCDACRVSSDVSPFWGSIIRNAKSICCSYFFNGNWWLNDPDFLIVRGKDTFAAGEPIYRTWWFPREEEFEPSLDVYRTMHSRHATLSLEEARTHASLELVAGGARVLSDPIRLLNDAGLEMTRRAISADTAPGRPLDIFAEDGMSRIWIQELGDITRVGMFNWDNCTQTIELDSDRLGFDISGRPATDFWTGAKVGIAGPKAGFELGPHCSRVLEFG
ncbi:MAG: alpha-galactosidase [bacterium]|nr:alpha-galactosidase [bacterium]